MTYAVKADPLILAHAKIADLELMLSQARFFVKLDADRPRESQDYAHHVLKRIDTALEGTVHSFSRNGAHR